MPIQPPCTYNIFRDNVKCLCKGVEGADFKNFKTMEAAKFYWDNTLGRYKRSWIDLLLDEL